MAVVILVLLIAAAILAGLRAAGVNPVRPHLGWTAVCLGFVVLLLLHLP